MVYAEKTSQATTTARPWAITMHSSQRRTLVLVQPDLYVGCGLLTGYRSMQNQNLEPL